MFDATRFAATESKSNVTSVVSEYEVSATASEVEIALVYSDLVIVGSSTVVFVIGIGLLVSWVIIEVSYWLICVVSVVMSVFLALVRYLNNVNWLKNRIAWGRVDWDKHEAEIVRGSKTKLVYIDYQALSQGKEQPSEIKFGLDPEFSFPPAVIQKVFSVCVKNDYRFTRNLMKSVPEINDGNYNTLLTEMMEAGYVKLRGKEIKQGVRVSKEGKAIMKSRLLPSPTNQ